MLLEFNDNGIGKNIFIKKDNKCLQILYGATDDLYLDIKEKGTKAGEKQKLDFTINKDEIIYSYFLNLINQIKNCNVYKVTKSELMFCNNEEDKKRLLIKQKVMNQELKQSEIYKNLVKNDVIAWFSDETVNEKANKLELEIKENNIILTFTKNPEDETLGFGVRVCNSGSKSRPFNLCFMEFYKNIQELNSTNIDNESITL